VAVLVLLVLSPRVTFAHCDSLDGPVVKAAQKALETGDVRMVLPWVSESSEPEVTAAFRRALAVRTLGADATELADLYFYETVVRVHRAGEGEPYTGLKPAGQVLQPAIAAADRAIATGATGPLIELVTTTAAASIRERFDAVLQAKREATPQDVAAGRRFVAAYVSFLHHVERLFEAATTSDGGHHPEVEAH
jgi:hypothetical protein